MKTRLIRLAMLAAAALTFQGCIAFPPLVQVERRDMPPSQDVIHRLDAIDRRLDAIDKRLETLEPKKP